MDNSYLLYEGPSLLDGEPIFVVLTGLKKKSRNKKTGDMLQTYILSARTTPTNALTQGFDYSICGNCPHRYANKGSCYVNIAYAPYTIYKAYKNGSYKFFTEELLLNLQGKVLRFGSYGDPAAVPVEVWNRLKPYLSSWTGYTHQWRERPDLKNICMASVDSREEYHEAKTLGWRTFRVLAPTEENITDEIACPASEEAGKLTTCAKCKLCKGTSIKAKDISIRVHGKFSQNFTKQTQPSS